MNIEKVTQNNSCWASKYEGPPKECITWRALLNTIFENPY